MLRLFRNYPIAVRWLFAIYIFCFGGATIRHISDIVRAGWLPYDFVPFWINLYWTSLTFFDPLAVLLIFISPLAALILANLIMLSDVAINSYVTYGLFQDTIVQSLFLQAQTAFLIFVVLTTPLIWRKVQGFHTDIS